MELTIQAAHGSVHIRTDDDRLRIEAGGQVLDTTWADVAGAGLADAPGRRRPVVIDPEIADVTPLLGRLQRAASDLAATHRLLLVAHGPKRRLYQVSVPGDRPEVAALIAELEARLGPRWLGVDQDRGDLQHRLGATTPRWYPLAGIVFVAALVLLTLPVIAAGVAVRDAIEDLDPTGIEPWMVVVLLVWVVAVGALLARIGRLFR